MTVPRTAKNALVLLTHRERVAKCTSFEEFQVVQIRLLDYMIEDQLLDGKSEELVEKFVKGDE